ncbi:MAG: glutamate--tRNA ligase [bacterium]
MTTSEVRVRIAPAPSGYLHVGTVRAAIFNWLFARNQGGKFLLRIEDTNLELSEQKFVDIILDGLRWLGLESDEEVVYQSQRLESYKPHAAQLLSEGKAYRCFCAPDELNQKRKAAEAAKQDYRYDRTCRDLTEEQVMEKLAANLPFTIRLKLPSSGTAVVEDAVLGKIERDYTQMDDFIIVKSDGNAIYNFAVVVDDHRMRISHVIRGNDHVNNTFLQQQLYEALGWEKPIFAHVPLVLRPDKAKLSKRKGDPGVTEYRDQGYLPEAMFNFLALLGWSPKDDREVISREEMIKIFSIEGIGVANAIFDPQKLTWMNGEYLRQKTDHQIAELVAPLLVEKGLTTKYYLETRWQWLMSVVRMLKERCRLLPEFAEIGYYFFVDEFEYDAKGVKKQFRKEGVAQLLEKLAARFEQVGDFTKESSEQALQALAEELEINAAQLIHPTRLAVSGLTGGPPLYDMLAAIGKERVVKRLRKAIEFINNLGGSDGE